MKNERDPREVERFSTEEVVLPIGGRMLLLDNKAAVTIKNKSGVSSVRAIFFIPNKVHLVRGEVLERFGFRPHIPQDGDGLKAFGITIDSEKSPDLYIDDIHVLLKSVSHNSARFVFNSVEPVRIQHFNYEGIALRRLERSLTQKQQ